MSTTGKRTVGWQNPALLPTLLAAAQPGREDYIAGSAQVWKLIGSPAYPEDQEEVPRSGPPTPTTAASAERA